MIGFGVKVFTLPLGEVLGSSGGGEWLCGTSTWNHPSFGQQVLWSGSQGRPPPCVLGFSSAWGPLFPGGLSCL